MSLIRLAVLATVCVGTVSVHAAEPFIIDASHSSVVFRVKHLNVSYSYGRFNKMSGKIDISRTNPEDGQINLTIEMNSIDTANADRDKHLRGPDFFNTSQFPTATFSSRMIRKISDTKLEVEGEFELAGNKKMIKIPVELTGEGKSPFGDVRTGVEAVFKINRSDFGIIYRKDMLGDEVVVMASLEGARK